MAGNANCSSDGRGYTFRGKQDENLYAKRLDDTSAYLRASSQYLDKAGRPSDEAELSKLQFVGFDHPEQPLELMASPGLNLTTANFNFSTASFTMTVELIRLGYGIGFPPLEIAEKYPELKNAYSEFEPIQVEAWLVAHRELRTSPRIRLAFDLLSDGLG